jgi:hypothetical protein
MIDYFKRCQLNPKDEVKLLMQFIKIGIASMAFPLNANRSTNWFCYYLKEFNDSGCYRPKSPYHKPFKMNWCKVQNNETLKTIMINHICNMLKASL